MHHFMMLQICRVVETGEAVVTLEGSVARVNEFMLLQIGRVTKCPFALGALVQFVVGMNLPVNLEV